MSKEEEEEEKIYVYNEKKEKKKRRNNTENVHWPGAFNKRDKILQKGRDIRVRDSGSGLSRLFP
jgi:hypothetical protein